MANRLPVEGELVIATVTKIQYHSVFCRLDEYKTSGMIHISEIAPGRIKNITDYVKEGKTLIAKVLRIDQEKGHIDLSIRRVTDAQRKQKSNELKQEQIVKKIVEKASIELKKKPEEIDSLLVKEYQDHQNLYAHFQSIVEEGENLVGVDKKTAEVLLRVINERIKPREVQIKGQFSITTYKPDGVTIIKHAFKEMPENAKVFYEGAGHYTLTINAPDYKQAEETLKHTNDQITSLMGEEAEVSFTRTDK